MRRGYILFPYKNQTLLFLKIVFTFFNYESCILKTTRWQRREAQRRQGLLYSLCKTLRFLWLRKFFWNRIKKPCYKTETKLFFCLYKILFSSCLEKLQIFFTVESLWHKTETVSRYASDKLDENCLQYEKNKNLQPKRFSGQKLPTRL